MWLIIKDWMVVRVFRKQHLILPALRSSSEGNGAWELCVSNSNEGFAQSSIGVREWSNSPAMFRAVFGNKKEGGGKRGDKKSHRHPGEKNMSALMSVCVLVSFRLFVSRFYISHAPREKCISCCAHASSCIIWWQWFRFSSLGWFKWSHFN